MKRIDWCSRWRRRENRNSGARRERGLQILICKCTLVQKLIRDRYRTPKLSFFAKLLPETSAAQHLPVHIRQCPLVVHRPLFDGVFVSASVIYGLMGDCSLVRRFYSPKVRKSEINGSSFRRFVSPNYGS